MHMSTCCKVLTVKEVDSLLCGKKKVVLGLLTERVHDLYLCLVL